jgi:hypothetical protein
MGGERALTEWQQTGREEAFARNARSQDSAQAEVGTLDKVSG